MKTEKNTDGRKHIYLACATGFSIVLMAWVSKKVLPEPLSYLELGLPPFLATLGEVLWSREGISLKLKTWHVIAAVLFSTGLIILLNA